MSKLKTPYTPGPWTDLSAGSDVMVSTNADHDRAMAISCYRSGNSLQEDKANGRLVAAAPELAQALRAMFDHYENGTTSPILDAARAALAKAGV